MRPAPLPRLFDREVRRIHCVGLGDLGLGSLAVYLVQLGFHVTGDDDALAESTRTLLTREQVVVSDMPADCDLVVYSSAIARGHPVFVAALARQLPLVRRGEMLAEVVRDKKLVAICGAHGKTTTTAMLITALRRGHFPAGYVLGGNFNDDTSPARVGSNDWVVAEIDQADAASGQFFPEITVAVNLDSDLPGDAGKGNDAAAACSALMERTRGTILVSDLCVESQRLKVATAAERGASAAERKTRPEAEAPAPHRATMLSFGQTGDFSGEIAGEVDERMTLRLGGNFSGGKASVRARGDFNAANATAALAAAQLMGVSLAVPLLADYAGVRRRQGLLRPGRPTVLEDCAHHPAEIRALLGSLRSRVSAPGKLVVVFQPHRFSRTAQFKAEFAAALALADRVHLLDVDPAGESPVAGGTSADIYAELKRTAPGLPVSYLPAGDSDFFRTLSRDTARADLVAFVGAGDVDQKARAWVAALELQAKQNEGWDELMAALKTQVSPATRLKREESLAAKTTMRVGGAARVYAEPASLEDLRALWREARIRSVPLFILGRGSNVIVPDEGVDGLVLTLAHPTWSSFEPRPDGRVWVGAGLRLKNLCGLAGKAGLTGFEFLEGIPGSVGGALRMNAGAMGGWMFDVVEEVRLITDAGEIRTLRKEEMHVEYRHCAELHHAIALGALLRPAAQSDAAAISRQIDTYRRKRHESQPREPSAGCIFKNPAGHSAGRLIDESGLKGARVGDAEVSPVHANFIVNRGKATSRDVLELVRRVRARVHQVSGIDLEPEVLLYGKAWKDVL